MRRLILLVIVVCFTQAALPQDAAHSVAFDRVQSLQHGINLSGWFASSDLSSQHLDTFTNEADLRFIHQMGFDSVRIGIAPDRKSVV